MRSARTLRQQPLSATAFHADIYAVAALIADISSFFAMMLADAFSLSFHFSRFAFSPDAAADVFSPC